MLPGQKHTQEVGGGVGGGRKREKISAYHVSVSRSRLGTRRGFSIMDKLLIRWALWPTLPSISVCLCLHSAHPLPPREFASHPRRVLFSLTGQLPQKMPKQSLASSRGRGTTFHFNYSIDFPPRLLSPLSFLPFISVVCVPRLIIGGGGTQDKIMHTH